jgi:coenzyme F420-0:L-glutamate ligase / coenzyme F420-1:gamma-L-glutamate ligase
MNNFVEMIRTRRSIRRYQNRRLREETVAQLLTAATWAPSAHNRQPWRFVVIEARETREQLAAAMGAQLRRDLAVDGLPSMAIEKDAARSFNRITGAPLLILLCLTLADMDVYPDERRRRNEATMAVQSVAMAGQNLMLAAHSFGLGACWLCAPLFCPEIVKQVLDLPDEWQPQGLITVGYPAEEKEKTRQSFNTRVLYR